ncbi:MAG: glycosyltransferase family 4 protein [Gammaproteobacteria bacterium]
MGDAIAMFNLTSLGQGEGGALHQIALVRGFRACGWRVRLVVPRRAGRDQVPADLRDITWQTPSVECMGLPRSLDSWLQIPALVWLRLTGRADILYIRANLFSWAVIAVARLLGMYVISEHNGWSASERLARGGGGLPVRLETMAQVLVGRWSQRSRCVTAGIARLLIRHGVDPVRVFVVGNGVDTREMRPRRVPTVSGSADRPVQLGFIGGLVRWQGIDTAIRALSLLEDLPHLQLTIAGDGPERGRLEALANDLGVSSRVTFLGYIPYQRAAEVINSFDIALAPFTVERNAEIGLSPIKIRDYAAAGRIVVASGIEGIRDFESAGWLFTHRADDPDDLATTIRRVMSMPPGDFAQRGAMAREYAQRHFDWNRIVDRIREEMPESPKKTAPSTRPQDEPESAKRDE